LKSQLQHCSKGWDFRWIWFQNCGARNYCKRLRIHTRSCYFGI
jgi:hypothetical protein